MLYCYLMKLFFGHKHNDKGFTLTELVVAMALIGLIAVAVTSIILMASKSQSNAKISSKEKSEIIKLENAFKDKLTIYDSVGSQISVLNHMIIITAGGNSFSVTTEPSTYCEYENDELKNTILFSAIKDVSFELIGDNIICCKAKLADSDYKILFYIKAATVSAGEQP